MYNVGLSASDTRKYYADLAKSHRVRLSIRLLNLSHTPVSGDIAAMLLDGQIDGQLIEVDRRANTFADFDDPAILHTLSMQLLDPGYTLGFDTGVPSDAALYLDRMVQVVRYDFCPSLGVEVECPMFTGPVSNLKRDNDIVTISAQSKEALAANPANQTHTYGAIPVTTLIRDLLGRTGESGARIKIPSRPARGAKGWALIRESRPWSKAYWLADIFGANLFYDGDGDAKFTGNRVPVFRFDGSNIVEFPSREYGTDQVCNMVRVIVGGGAGDKPKFDVTSVLPANHPNSSTALARGGVPRWNLVTITDDNIRTAAEAKARADEELRRRHATVAGARFGALTVPPLELGDYVNVVVEGRVSLERVTAFSKPLRVDGVMSVGQTSMVSRPRRRR